MKISFKLESEKPGKDKESHKPFWTDFIWNFSEIDGYFQIDND